MVKSPKEFNVKICNNEIKEFVKKNHYSHSVIGVSSVYNFKLTYNNKIVGAMIYGYISAPNAYKKYVDKKEDMLELRRLCCIDDTPKNTESYFISKTLKWLILNTNVKKIISYADPEYGHNGLIYQASNFEHIGMTNTSKIVLFNNKKYHLRCLTKNDNGEFPQFKQNIINGIKTGETTFKKTKPKYIYLYDLEKRRNKKRFRNLIKEGFEKW